MRHLTIAAILAAALLSACAVSGPVPSADEAAAERYARRAAEVVKATDWSRMQTVEVELAEHSYTPRELRLKAHQPYKIVLRNSGEKDHYYSAPEFFRAVATRKFQVPRGGEVKAPYFTAVEIYKRGVGELFVVPVDKGSFPVYCTIDDHRDNGMEGVIVVE